MLNETNSAYNIARWMNCIFQRFEPEDSRLDHLSGLQQSRVGVEQKTRSGDHDPSALRAISPEHFQKPEPGKRTVLLVEDDQSVSQIAVMLIKRLGLEVVQTASAEDGWLKAKRQPPIAIITDVNLPGLSGLKLCEMLKSDPATKEISILVWSGNPAYREAALAAGAVEFFTKPDAPMRAVEWLKRLPGLVKQMPVDFTPLESHDTPVK